MTLSELQVHKVKTLRDWSIIRRCCWIALIKTVKLIYFLLDLNLNKRRVAIELKNQVLPLSKRAVTKIFQYLRITISDHMANRIPITIH